jgi:hypothetical protein
MMGKHVVPARGGGSAAYAAAEGITLAWTPRDPRPPPRVNRADGDDALAGLRTALRHL